MFACKIIDNARVVGKCSSDDQMHFARFNLNPINACHMKYFEIVCLGASLFRIDTSIDRDECAVTCLCRFEVTAKMQMALSSVDGATARSSFVIASGMFPVES